ncbi:hypothetical protein ABZ621_21770 [Streptomyces sp. NPDC007863]|uniref:hypothetical protein n=1 Tax=Streptomyces sp. NPDC007863 TaxID=3154894 RepID=UPI0033C73F78
MSPTHSGGGSHPPGGRCRRTEYEQPPDTLGPLSRGALAGVTADCTALAVAELVEALVRPAPDP